jgi:hypothetical protein
MEKFRIRDPDKHPGSATLDFLHIIHVPYPTVSCFVVDCHRFHAGSGAFHINGDPDPDPTLFYK